MEMIFIALSGVEGLQVEDDLTPSRKGAEGRAAH